jgi:hypothetical protein
MEVDIGSTTFDVASSNESNLREDDLTSIIEVYDMISDLSNNQHIKLQQSETNLVTGITTSWAPNYNFQVQPLLTVVNSTNLSMDTHFVVPLPSGDRIQIVAEVRDQYNFPVFNETVQFSAALNPLSDAGNPGTFDPSLGVTNSSGTVSTEYTPSATSSPILIDITAEVL